MGITGRERIVAAVATVLQLLNAQPGSSPEPSNAASGVGFIAAIAAGASLVARRRAPLLVLGAATVGYLVQAGLTGPSVPVVLTVAAYSAARHGPPLWGPVSAASSTVAVSAILAVIDEIGVAPLYDVAILLAVLAGALASNLATRRTGLRRHAATEERLRIARDLHDIVGHGMGAITVQAGAGRMALEADARDEVRLALTAIEQAGRDVLRETRWLVGLLRDQPDAPRMADIATLVDAGERAGLTVDYEVGGSLDAPDDATQEAAYRIVQEALTNAVRHSGASCCSVQVTVAEEVTIEIRDEGVATGEGVEGHGIPGMRERARAIGGDLTAGPAAPGPGWVVTARLPRSRSVTR